MEPSSKKRRLAPKVEPQISPAPSATYAHETVWSFLRFRRCRSCRISR